MLVLLIIFMVLSPLLIQGIEVNLPKTDTTKMSVTSEPLVISIDKLGEYYINLGEEQLPISLMELKNKAKIIFQANPDIEIVFKIADSHFANNNHDNAFEILLRYFPKNREKVKSKILSFFDVLGIKHESVVLYRKKLSSMMFS